MMHSTRGVVLAVLAVLLAACTPPLPPDVLAAKAEASITCQSGAQEVSIADEFVGSMGLVSGALAGPCPEQSIVEVAADAPAAVRIIDHAPTADDVAAFTCPTEPIIVPAFAYGVTAAYSIVGLEGLVLTPPALAGILNGTITAWDDPAIAEANADVDLSGLPPITVLSLDRPTGAVEAMTSWLAKEAPQAWTAGTVGTLPNSTTFATIADLVAELSVTEGAVAILPAFEAINNTIPMANAMVGDQVISADDTQLQKVGSGATTVTVDDRGNMAASPAVGGVPVEGNFDAAAAKIVLAEGQPLVGWPIVGYAHMIVCDDPANPLALSTAQYLVRLAGQGSLETFGVTPLPEPIRVKAFLPLKVTVQADASATAS